MSLLLVSTVFRFSLCHSITPARRIFCPDGPEQAAAILEQHLGHPVRRTDDAIYAEGENGQALAASVIRQLTLADIEVLGVNVTVPTLEDVFVRLTGRAIRDESASAKDRMGSRLRSRGRLRR